MFGIGYQEMFIILVVALVIFGPSRLPELAGQVGRWVRDFRRMSADLTGEFEKTFAEVDEVKKSFTRELQGIQDEVEGIGKSAKRDLKKSAGKVPAGAKKAPGALKAGAGSGAAGSNRSRAADLASGRSGTAAGTNVNGKPTQAVGDQPLATKADPLVDVSFLDLDAVLASSPNGPAVVPNGPTGEEDAALSRVRRRRAAAAYGRRNSA